MPPGIGRLWTATLFLFIVYWLVALANGGSLWHCSEKNLLCKALHCPPPHNSSNLLECLNFAFKKDLWAHEAMAWEKCTKAYELKHRVTLPEQKNWSMEELMEIDGCRMDTMHAWGISPVIYEFRDL